MILAAISNIWDSQHQVLLSFDIFYEKKKKLLGQNIDKYVQIGAKKQLKIFKKKIVIFVKYQVSVLSKDLLTNN